ncbi:MAG: urease accessory protein UreD, partial [Chthoniobacteraceae bacterium]
MSERATRGLVGHLHLVCAADADGRSYLRSQSFRAPIHLSKPHEDEGVLVVNVVNPTAGLLAGDRIEVRVSVENGARLLLTAPSASRAHCAPEGHAELVQEFDVAAGGWLDVWPELFIPQGGARYRQRTILRVEEGGEALFFETLAPGRVAMGEVFAYTALDWETDVFLGAELIARERYRLSPEGESVRALRGQFATGYYASCFVVSPLLGAESPCWRAIHELHGAEAWIGCSPLRRGGWVIKAVAAGSVALRRKLAAIRRELYA